MSALISRAAAAAARRHWGARDGLSGFRGSTRIAENPDHRSLENAVRGAFCSRSVSTSGTHMHFTSGDDDERCERDKPGDKGVPIVYHPAYSKPVLPEGHRFPMPVFREIYKRLIRDGVAVPGANLYQPARMLRWKSSSTRTTRTTWTHSATAPWTRQACARSVCRGARRSSSGRWRRWRARSSPRIWRSRRASP